MEVVRVEVPIKKNFEKIKFFVRLACVVVMEFFRPEFEITLLQLHFFLTLNDVVIFLGINFPSLYFEKKKISLHFASIFKKVIFFTSLYFKFCKFGSHFTSL